MTDPTERAAPALGARPVDGGVAFGVWAPHADAVYVYGSFNGWSEQDHPLERGDDDCWYGTVAAAAAGDEYRYLIVNGGQRLPRIDPYAREVTSSVGNGVIRDRGFDWQDDAFVLPPWNELVIYEMHLGTFHRSDDDRPGGFDDAVARFEHLRKLGVNALQLMPVAEFAGDLSWGYNPAHPFAVEQSYGGPDAFKRFVREAHRAGFAVLLDVVYNHFGPGDLDLWRFDGWHEGEGGGIYFYNDWRGESPWGHTRPDYGRPQVRRYICDNALMWLDEYRVDGLRFDMTLYIRSVRGDGDPGAELPDGWSLLAELNRTIAARHPGRLTIAEDLRNDAALTAPTDAGGAGFSSQWDAAFVHPVRDAAIADDDAERSVDAVIAALAQRYNDDAFRRVIYSESHDEVANGRARIPHEIAPDDPGHWAAQKRSTLAAALALTAPGIPMLFQGQEFLEGGWFRDTVPLDWERRDDYRGILRLYRDLIRLRLNRDGATRGLCGQGLEVVLRDDQRKLLAYRRRDRGGAGDDTLVVVNLSAQPHELTLELADGVYALRLNSDWRGYSDAFGDHPSADLDVVDGRADATVAPYAVLIYGYAGALPD